MQQLICEDVTLRYGNVIAVSEVSFTVEPGETACIVGENGSGKTTLLRGILGLMPLSGGLISFEGQGKERIGYLPQHSDIQSDFPASVEEVVGSGLVKKRGLRPFATQEEKATALESMERFQVDAFRRKPFQALSAGQKQRVLLARAFCSDPTILVLDEPVTGLDPLMTTSFYHLLEQLHQAQVTIIMTTHDIEGALASADKILHLERTVQFYGTPEEYRQSSHSRKLMR